MAPGELTGPAEALGALLADTEAFQALARWSRAVRLDPQVSELVSVLKERQYRYDERWDPEQTAALEAQIEALPVVCAFRDAEAQARALFAAIDEAISAAAGVPFAQLAKPSGHG
jgi:cell fate (sporulation/competence/biofilm development) regulator YlbF (YheA/YmcA/DUF963 family)